ncbi:hypothetical protein J6590_002046 [Homalodisca vitripennis]|nr:hypothetical protein J6590_002046 [Homalodisca vitripennis]
MRDVTRAAKAVRSPSPHFIVHVADRLIHQLRQLTAAIHEFGGPARRGARFFQVPRQYQSHSRIVGDVEMAGTSLAEALEEVRADDLPFVHSIGRLLGLHRTDRLGDVTVTVIVTIMLSKILRQDEIGH